MKKKICQNINDEFNKIILGIKKGKEEGIKEGIEKGSKNEKINIAKNMLKDNVDINIISKYSGLSIEEIENLQ